MPTVDIFLAVTLLILGAAATLAAFGGKTWNEGSEPILERITPRGWFSLACLVLALGFGVWKELRASRDKETSRLQSEAQQKDLTKRITDSQHQVELSSLALAKVQETLTVTRQFLDDTLKSLHHVQHNLDQTHDDLNQQIAASSVSALVSGDQRIESVQVIIPFTSKGRNSINLNHAMLPVFPLAMCNDLMGVTVAVATQTDHFEISRLASMT